MRLGSCCRRRRTRDRRESSEVATSDSARTPASTERFLRVDEAARILRIGRSAAYEQANRWIATNGQCGLPAVKVGRMIRIPAAVLEAWATTGSDAEPISQDQ
jgi:excisionase family DNA binding protein